MSSSAPLQQKGGLSVTGVWDSSPQPGREAWPLCPDSDLQTYWSWNLHSQFQGPAHGPAGELPRISGRVRLQRLAAGRPLPCAWGACMC